jgi:hypothetical protein
MQSEEYTELYLVTGTASGSGYSGPVGFLVMAAPPSDFTFSDGSTYEYPGAPSWAVDAWLSALAGLFNNATYGDGTTSMTVTDAVVTQVNQVQTNVTPS